MLHIQGAQLERYKTVFLSCRVAKILVALIVLRISGLVPQTSSRFRNMGFLCLNVRLCASKYCWLLQFHPSIQMLILRIN